MVPSKRRFGLKLYRDTGFWIRALTVLAVVFGTNLIIEFGVLTSVFPLFHKLQLESHEVLCWLLPRPASAKWTRMVAIDEKLHEKLGVVTDRSYLAALVRNAAQGDAAVIVLDFQFTLLNGMKDGEDDPTRARMNDDLKNAIFDAAKLGVPVIVPCWLDRDKKTVFPSVFADTSLPLAWDGVCAYPACARRGNVNPADDERKIPLRSDMHLDPGRSKECQDSLALATVMAYEEATHREPRTRDKPTIAEALRDYRYVYGSFIAEKRSPKDKAEAEAKCAPPSAEEKCETDDTEVAAAGVVAEQPEQNCKIANFQTIPIRCLHKKQAEAMREARTRIVIIGGEWKEAPGRPDLFDEHETSVGPMLGMYLHANYIETLLDDRYMKEVPAVPALLFDIVVAALLYLSYHRAKNTRGRYVILSVFLIPLMTGYIVFVTLGYYLDFVLPLAGCFVHLGFEFVSDDIEMRRERREREAAEGRAAE